jgi:hypothetical protein
MSALQFGHRTDHPLTGRVYNLSIASEPPVRDRDQLRWNVAPCEIHGSVREISTNLAEFLFDSVFSVSSVKSTVSQWCASGGRVPVVKFELVIN